MNISDGIMLPLKQVLIGVVIVAVVGLYPLGYLKGVSHQKQLEKDEYSQKLEEMLNSYSLFQVKLDTIAQGQQATIEKLKQKQEGVKDEVKDYGKNPNSGVKCLDSEWVRVYNNSLRKTASDTSSKVDVRTRAPEVSK